jgi:hypothetical protein
MTDFEQYTLCIRIFNNILVVVAIIYTAYQFRRSANIHRDNLEWSKRIETRKKLDDHNLFESAKYLNDKFGYVRDNNPIQYTRIEEEFNKDNAVDVHLSILMNYYESIAIGIDNHIYDELLVKASRKTAMMQIYDSFRSFVEFHRRNGSPRCFTRYEALINKWREEDRIDKTLPKLGKV